MFEIISSKKTSLGTELVYRLRSSVDSGFLQKMNELGDPSLTKFHRFDRLAHPQFKIKNAGLGVEVRGKIGENFLYCVVNDNHEDGQQIIETTLRNV